MELKNRLALSFRCDSIVPREQHAPFAQSFLTSGRPFLRVAKQIFLPPTALSLSNRVLCSIALLSVALGTALTTQPLEAQSTQSPGVVSISVSTDKGGVAMATEPAHHASRVLVHSRNGARAAFLPGSPSATNFPGDPNLQLVQNPPGLSVADALRHYQADPDVLYAEPDYIIQVDVTPTDPRWSQQWDMVKISAPTAWNTQTDSGTVIIAVIDTGIDFTHPDLQANLWTNTDGS